MTTLRLALMLLNAAFAGAALACAITNHMDGKPTKGALTLAAINFGAIAIALA